MVRQLVLKLNKFLVPSARPVAFDAVLQGRIGAALLDIVSTELVVVRRESRSYARQI